MDFYAPPPIIDALQRRAAEGVFGYASHFPGLYENIRARLQRLYGWEVAQEEIALRAMACSLIHPSTAPS